MGLGEHGLGSRDGAYGLPREKASSQVRKRSCGGATTPCEKPSSQAQERLKPDNHPPYHPTEIAPSSLIIETEIPAQLQGRTNDLLLELRSELGKDAANQFVSIRSAVYYRDNGPPSVDPQALVGPGSPNTDESLEVRLYVG
jgi:hypothetical protein